MTPPFVCLHPLFDLRRRVCPVARTHAQSPSPSRHRDRRPTPFSLSPGHFFNPFSPLLPFFSVSSLTLQTTPLPVVISPSLFFSRNFP
ncbi:hypothetical protein VTJ04DRAFT_8739 [Mycothermus thermophilus]|uniref:uncharacterized protein n=1 Tax=Humicola insolens TaxID=85995 RepID=UPI0037448F88